VSGDLCLLCLCITKGRKIEVEVELRLRAEVGQRRSAVALDGGEEERGEGRATQAGRLGEARLKKDPD
jgi:hypothetical protein